MYPRCTTLPCANHCRQRAQPFHLLDLPTELLLQILALAVATPDPICIHAPPSTEKAGDSVFPSRVQTSHLLRRLEQPPITRVNKLLRQEGLKLFYGMNTLHGVNWSEPLPRSWITRIAAEWRRDMRVLLTSGWEAKDVESHFGSARIRRVRSREWWSSANDALQMFCEES